METIKKIISIFLGSCIILSLSACSMMERLDEYSKRESVTYTNDEYRGVYKGNVYENEAFDLCVTLPENWEFYNKKEIAELNGMIDKEYEGINVPATVDENARLTVLFAVNDDGLIFLNIVHAVKHHTDREIFEISKDFYIRAFEERGVAITTDEIVTMTFCGEEKDCMHITYYESDGVQADSYMIYIQNESNYWGQLSIVSFSEDNDADASSYLRYFSKMD